MISWERFGEWIATVAVASFAWVSSVVAPGVPVGSSGRPVLRCVDQNQLSSIMRWAQQEDELPIEQVGEDTDETSKRWTKRRLRECGGHDRGCRAS